MHDQPTLTDRAALLRNRARVQRMADPARFLQDEAADEIQERLTFVNRTFKSPAIVTGWPEIWENRVPGAKVIEDADVLDLEPGAHDLVIHAMAMHWANDPVGQMIQAKRALCPDGMFIAALFGGQTLTELRAVLAEAEVHLSGGLSPRIAPMAEIRDLGALLQRAGFALPVADNALRTVTYASALHLMRDLRAMGESNAMTARNRAPALRALFQETARRYDAAFAADGRIPASFEIVYLTGWAPDDSQPKPLRPGSAQARLADALHTAETPLPRDDTDPSD